MRTIIAAVLAVVVACLGLVTACHTARGAEQNTRVVVELVGLNCPYCRAIEPDIQALKKAGYLIQQIVSDDDDAEQSISLASGQQLKGNGGGFMEAFNSGRTGNNRITKVPTMVLLDGQTAKVLAVRGLVRMDANAIQQQLKAWQISPEK